jgi:hypothetical protein
MLDHVRQSGKAAAVIKATLDGLKGWLGTFVSVIGRLAMNRLEQLSSTEFCANLWPQLCAESNSWASFTILPGLTQTPKEHSQSVSSPSAHEFVALEYSAFRSPSLGIGGQD